MIETEKQDNEILLPPNLAEMLFGETKSFVWEHLDEMKEEIAKTAVVLTSFVLDMILAAQVLKEGDEGKKRTLFSMLFMAWSLRMLPYVASETRYSWLQSLLGTRFYRSVPVKLIFLLDLADVVETSGTFIIASTPSVCVDGFDALSIVSLLELLVLVFVLAFEIKTRHGASLFSTVSLCLQFFFFLISPLILVSAPQTAMGKFTFAGFLMSGISLTLVLPIFAALAKDDELRERHEHFVAMQGLKKEPKKSMLSQYYSSLEVDAEAVPCMACCNLCISTAFVILFNYYAIVKPAKEGLYSDEKCVVDALSVMGITAMVIVPFMSAKLFFDVIGDFAVQEDDNGPVVQVVAVKL